MKRQRLYRLTIQIPDTGEIIILQSPLTAQINISYKIGAKANTCDIAIKGLSRENRNKIFKDVMLPSIYMPITVEAGYDNNLTLLFSGNIMWAYSEREFPTVSTKIHVWSGGYDIINSRSHITLSKSQGVGDILKILTKDFKYVTTGELGSIASNDARFRGCNLNGKTIDLINRYANDKALIHNDKLYILNDNEVIQGTIDLINSSTGLLGTPKKQDNLLEIDTIFEPNLTILQMVKVESDILPLYNGQYKVTGLVHDLFISEVECGKAVTKLTCVLPNAVVNQYQGFNLVQNNVVSPINDLNSPIDSNTTDAYNYIVKNGTVPNWRITTQITWKQMLTNFRSGNAFHPSNEMPTQQQLQNVKKTANALQSFVDNYYKGHNININSGWRSKTGSYHVAGEAVDFTLSGVSSQAVQNTLEGTGLPYGIGLAPNHVHMDLRGYRAVFQDSDF